MQIIDKLRKGRQFSILIDPDKHSAESIREAMELADPGIVDFILVGGSFVSSSVDLTISMLKDHTNLPVILFPGNVLQISDRADGILLLSLISGRNPEFLIGNHVIAAPLLRKTGLEIIPTGYILIENGSTTSVEYISNTKPIPSGKKDLAVATAMAGEMLGLHLIYLEAGSGAKVEVNTDMIAEVRKQISIPLIVGGGIDTAEKVRNAYRAGADIVVVGSALEENPSNFRKMLENIPSLKIQ